MIDREKVIKGLEHARDNMAIAVCYSSERATDIQTINDALELLKADQSIIEKYHKADGFLAVHGWKWEEDHDKIVL